MLPVLMLLFVGRVRRRLCFRLRRLVLVAPRLRVVHRLLFRRLLRPVRAAVWSLLFLRLVRLVCFLRRRLRVALPVSVRVLGLRWLLLLAWAFRLWFFRVFWLAFLHRRFCRRGLALGFLLVLAFGLPVFVLFLRVLRFFLFSLFLSTV